MKKKVLSVLLAAAMVLIDVYKRQQITWDEVLYNGGKPIEEQHVLKKMIFELMAQKGYAKSWGEAKLLVKRCV